MSTRTRSQEQPTRGPPLDASYNRGLSRRRWLGFVIGVGGIGSLVSGCREAADGTLDSREAARSPTTSPTDGDEAITQLLAPIRHKHQIPAIAAALVTSRGLDGVGAVGVRKWGAGVPVTAGDQWHLGSNTKAMTAALLGTLVQEDRLHWQSTVADVFSDMAVQIHTDLRPVTLLHLLAHRAGVPADLDWATFTSRGSLREQRFEAVRQALASAPVYPPGSACLYSNLGYVIAGTMAERVVDMSWEEALRARVFAPLQMASSGFGGLGTPGQIDQPWGHTQPRKPVRTNGPAVDNPPILGPAGTVHGTLQDWARFVADQLRGARGEPALLRPDTYRTLHTPPFGGEYALGWVVTDRLWGAGMVLNHCGCNTLFFANAWLAPRTDFGVLVCANQGLDAFSATDEAAAALVQLRTSRAGMPRP